MTNEEHTLRRIREAMPKGLPRAEIRALRLPGSLGVIQPLVESGLIEKMERGQYKGRYCVKETLSES